MILFVLAYLGGALTIASPCILPVLPFVFARADRPSCATGCRCWSAWPRPSPPSRRSPRSAAAGRRTPMRSAAWRRFGAAGRCSAWRCCSRPRRTADRAAGAPGRQACRNRPKQKRETARSAIGASLLLGVATGLLWAPCAGPILGLILTGAALQGASARDHAAAARLCAGRGDLAGAGLARRRAGVRRDEALARRSANGCGAASASPCWPASSRSRSALDTGFLTPLFVGEHGETGAGAARQVARLARCQRRRRAILVVMDGRDEPAAA